MLPFTSLFGFAYLGASIVLSSFNDLIVKAMGSHLPPAQMSFLRFIVAALIVLIFALLQKKRFTRIQYSFLDMLRGLFLFIGMSLWSRALHTVPLAQAVLMNFTIPFFQLLLGTFVLKEKLYYDEIAATFIGFIGVFLSCTDIQLDFSLVPPLLLASCLFAGCDLLNKMATAQSHQDDLLSTLFYTALYTASMGAIPALLVWQTPTLKECIGLIILGISSNMLFFFLLQALARLTLVQTAPFRYMELVISASLAYVVFGEIPSLQVMTGAALIIPAALWVVLHKRNEERCL
jgi:S-adenosylmethionine uptake transporter